VARATSRSDRAKLVNVKLDISTRKRSFLIGQVTPIRVFEEVITGDALPYFESAYAFGLW
jgi:hypothetical protein